MSEQKIERQDRLGPPVISGDAPASMNFFGITKAGWNVQFTLRDIDEDALMIRFARFVGILEKYQVTPKPVGQQPQASLPQPSAPQTPANAPNTPPTAAQAQASTESFDAAILCGSINGSKTYWKVKGGRFSKFGVAVWPEVLKSAGYDTDALDPRQEYNIQGFVAHYITDEEGKATKVTRLERK